MAAANVGGGVLTAAYRPGVYGPGLMLRNQGKAFTWFDVEDMRRDPRLSFGLEILAAPVAGARWNVKADADLAAFVDRQLKRLWQRDLPKMLGLHEYGTAAGEVAYRLTPDGWEADGLLDRHLLDCQPHAHQGQVTRLDVKNVAGAGGPVALPPGRFWWLADRPRFGSLYGTGRLKAAWEPWQEKRGQKGAIDCRRIWYFKNAHRGGMIRHPYGVIDLGDGVTRSCQEYARELLEKFESGGILVLPNATDEHGNYLWTFEPPAVQGNLSDVRDYVKDLDVEQLEAMGIPSEIVTAAESGSGWSGRSVPFVVFLTSQDRVVDTLLQGLDRQVLWWLVRANYGPGRRYEIEPVSLVPKEGEAQPQPEEQPRPAQPPTRPQPLQVAGGGQPPVQLSQAGGEQSADAAVDRIVERAVAAGVAVADEVRERVRALVKKNSPPTS